MAKHHLEMRWDKPTMPWQNHMENGSSNHRHRRNLKDYFRSLQLVTRQFPTNDWLGWGSVGTIAFGFLDVVFGLETGSFPNTPPGGQNGRFPEPRFPRAQPPLFVAAWAGNGCAECATPWFSRYQDINIPWRLSTYLQAYFLGKTLCSVWFFDVFCFSGSSFQKL